MFDPLTPDLPKSQGFQCFVHLDLKVVYTDLGFRYSSRESRR